MCSELLSPNAWLATTMADSASLDRSRQQSTRPSNYNGMALHDIRSVIEERIHDRDSRLLHVWCHVGIDT
jgi:predicted RNA polymerase sigma factor